MAHILIIDDEEVLRNSMARGIAKMDGVSVDQAGSLDEALGRIDRSTPDLIISDIDMPERSGIELLGELGKRGLSLPVVFVSAYLKAFRAQIPRHANIDALEKPLPLEELRSLVRGKLERGGESSAPFTVPDYLQLACMGRHSLSIEVSSSGQPTGEIVVHAGELWSARAGHLVGREAFAILAFKSDSKIVCRRIVEPKDARNLEGSIEALLMDSARQFDEAGGSNVDVDDLSWQLFNSSPPSSPLEEQPSLVVEEDEQEEVSVEATAREVFERHLDRGISALLERNYAVAWDAFSAANIIKPGDAMVEANLHRLRALGYSKEQEGEA